MFGKQFYPTPKALLEKISNNFKIKWYNYKNVLEPSAGRGDIADFIKEKNKGTIVDCIEIDANLKNVLKGKGYNVIYDNFLDFNTYKQYDLVFLNPPFSEGAAHLRKAISICKDGGEIICIINSETLSNPYSNERKALLNELDEIDDVEFVSMKHEFKDADRRTDVDITVVHIKIPIKQYTSSIYEEMRTKVYDECEIHDKYEITDMDFIQAAIMQYNIELKTGIKLIKEYKACENQMYDTLTPDAMYKTKIMNLIGKTNNEYINNTYSITINNYVESVRYKYWSALFMDPRFTKGMTSNLKKEYESKMEDMKYYEFNNYNIKNIQISFCDKIIRGIEECIISLFDEFSYKHYYDENSKNIHYYNGWKTNKSWIVNEKVILPINAYSNYFKELRYDYNIREKLSDIEKTLSYLDGNISSTNEEISAILKNAANEGITSNIHFKYFDVTFYKKGTCHIKFTNRELLKKFNIFGSQKKGWLPPSYGSKEYAMMNDEEKQVIDEFQGEFDYNDTLNNKDYYLKDLYLPVTAAS